MKKREPKEIAAVIGELARDAAGMIGNLSDLADKTQAVQSFELLESGLRSLVAEMTGLPPSIPSCVGCGSNENVSFEADPFHADVHNNHEPMWLCDKCLHEKRMDI